MVLAKVIKSLAAACKYCSPINEAVEKRVPSFLNLVSRYFVYFTSYDDVDEVI